VEFVEIEQPLRGRGAAALYVLVSQRRLLTCSSLMSSGWQPLFEMANIIRNRHHVSLSAQALDVFGE
jgi:hypothetical protein